MKKNKYPLALNRSILLFFTSCILLVAASCNFPDVSGTEPNPPNPPGPDPDPDPPADTIGTVAPDDTLEAVTWNVEWFGSGQAPYDDDLQGDNAVRVLDSLKADLYAFEEIKDDSAVNVFANRSKGYKGLIADQPRNQKTAFLYNTRTIEPVSTGMIAETEGQDYYDWASGRFPFYFSFKYHFKDESREPVPIYAIVIHAKASDDKTSYERRKRAIQSLYDYLTRNKPDANIILLGDYNDDVDESIYQGATTPYLPFVEDTDNFFVITKSLSEAGLNTNANYSDTIDHITVSNEMKAFYIFNSETRFVPDDSFIENYATNTSDHYPVMTKFSFDQ